MAVEIKVPALGESVTEATVAKWLVKAGDTVTIDQPLCELETDKVTVEVNATVAGSIVELAVAEGATVQVGGVLLPHRGRSWSCGAAAAAPKPAAAPPAPPAPPKTRTAPAPSAAAVVAPAAANANIACFRSGHAQASSRKPASRRRRSSRPARTAAPPRPT